MNTIELKTGISQYINQIDDNSTLENIYNYILFYSHKGTDVVEMLSEAQQKRLDLSLIQMENKETVPHNHLKQEIEQWLNK